MCNCTKETEMNQAQITSLAIAGGILFAAYKFGGKFGAAAAVAIGSVALAKQVPYLKAVV